jgi:hypothetical protein
MLFAADTRAKEANEEAPHRGAFFLSPVGATQRFCELESSSLNLVFLILSSRTSIAAISSLGCNSLRRIHPDLPQQLRLDQQVIAARAGAADVDGRVDALLHAVSKTASECWMSESPTRECICSE